MMSLSSPLLILAAMETEFNPLHAAFCDHPVRLNSPIPLQTPYADREVWLMQCGIGPVSTAFSLGAALERIRPGKMMMVGVGGGLCPKAKLGHLVVSSEVVQHDCALLEGEDPILLPPGRLFISCPEEERTSHILPCDAQLSAWLLKAAKKAQIPAHYAPIASGNSFVACHNLKQHINERHGAFLVDMESGAAAQIARDHGIPFTVAKLVTDAVGSLTASDEEYRQSLPAISALIEKLIRSAFDLGPAGIYREQLTGT